MLAHDHRGVVHHHVEPAEVALRAPDGFGHRRFVRDVENLRRDRGAGGAELFGPRFHGFVAVHQHQPGPRSCETLRQPGGDPAGAARHEHDPALEGEQGAGREVLEHGGQAPDGQTSRLATVWPARTRVMLSSSRAPIRRRVSMVELPWWGCRNTLGRPR